MFDRIRKAKEIAGTKRCPACNAFSNYLDYKIERNKDEKQRGSIKCRKCGFSDSYGWVRTDDLYRSQGDRVSITGGCYDGKTEPTPEAR